MQPVQIAALVVLAIFYVAYFSKQVILKRHGIHANQIAKGDKERNVLLIERLMKFATLAILVVELISIVLNIRMGCTSLSWAGIFIAALGVLLFIVAMQTMRESWRAGIPASDKTELITSGIYRLSRNPAFLGFDVMYIGILLAFFNFIHLLFALFAIIMLHLQILEEEKFCSETFGQNYALYKKHTGRYFLL